MVDPYTTFAITPPPKPATLTTPTLPTAIKPPPTPATLKTPTPPGGRLSCAKLILCVRITSIHTRENQKR